MAALFYNVDRKSCSDSYEGTICKRSCVSSLYFNSDLIKILAELIIIHFKSRDPVAGIDHRCMITLEDLTHFFKAPAVFT